MSLRKWSVALLGVVIIGGVSHLGIRLGRAWGNRTALAAIQRQLQEKRYAAAARNLTVLLRREPGSDEAACLLGNCERARGRPEAADQAWARVPPSSPLAASALMGRASLLVDQGRLADVEPLLTRALADPIIDGFELRQFLAPLYCNEGRVEEAQRLIETNWEHVNRTRRGGSAQAIKIELVRLHISLSEGISRAEMVRRFLERAGDQAPNDARVWLGKANLAIRQENFDEAARWIDACLKRPADAPVWRARLNWALSTARVADVREALEHLPADESPPAQIHRLAAWLAARRGDALAEKHALERLIAADPGDGEALQRLAELAVRANEAGRVDELRRRQDQFDRRRRRYHELFLRNQTVRNAEELARLAEQLGRCFEAKAFWSVAVEAEPDRADLRIVLSQWGKQKTPVATPGRTLAEVLAR